MESGAHSSLLSSHRAPWGRFLFFSLGAHVLAVGVLGALQAWASGPRLDLNVKPIDASLVRLGKPRDPKMLPRMEPSAPAPPPPTPAPPVPEPAAPPPPPRPSSVPSTVPSLPSKPAPPTPNVAARRAQLFGAFSKFSQTAHPPQEQEGAADGDPDGDSAKQEGDRYYGLLRANVHRHYDVSDTIPDDERIRLRAQVALKISRAGEVLKAELVRSSGNALYDSAVLAAVQRASPFPPPPDALRDRLQREGVVLEFTP